MAAVTIRFYGGFAAATQGGSVADFVGFAVSGNDWDSASYPEWSADAH